MKRKYVSLIVIFMLFMSLFIIGTFRNSYAIWNNTIFGSKDNQMTTGYVNVSVNGYDKIINVTNPMILSDALGINLVNESVYNINVSYHIDRDVQFELGIIPVSAVDNRDVKFYLTDNNNYSCDGYKDSPKLYTELQDDYGLKGKVLYNGILSADKVTENFKLKIWIDEKSIESYSALTYTVYIKIK